MYKVSPVSRTVAWPVNLSTIPPIPDHYTPHPAPVVWVGLGDSFTAGPGTGPLYEHDYCLRGPGSYVWQLYTDFPFRSPYNPTYLEQNFPHFVACIGFTTYDVRDGVLPGLSTLNPQPLDFMVMTLGANDLGFADITRFCLFSPRIASQQACEQAKMSAWDMITHYQDGGQLEERMFQVYDGIFASMSNDEHYQLYHIFYPTFFDTEEGSEWCDEWSFQGLFFPLLSMQRRRELNGLTYSLNECLRRIAINYISQMPARGIRGKLITINPNSFEYNGQYWDLFRGHRFCEHDDRDEYLFTDNTWFFTYADEYLRHAETTSATSRRQVEATFADRAVNSINLTDISIPRNGTNGTTVGVPEWLKKTFHPKPAGFARITWALQIELQRNRYSPSPGQGDASNKTRTPPLENEGTS